MALRNNWKYPRNVELRELSSGESQSIVVKSKDYYSRVAFKVEEGEKYKFEVCKCDRWVDFHIKTNALGFKNKWLNDEDKRVQEVDCFHLCGTIDMDDDENFSIGLSNCISIKKAGHLHFFANDKKDSRFANLNNWGSLSVSIERIV